MASALALKTGIIKHRLPRGTATSVPQLSTSMQVKMQVVSDRDVAGVSDWAVHVRTGWRWDRPSIRERATPRHLSSTAEQSQAFEPLILS